jgi:drug/metabolite transporter (DMT)-like permease
MLTAGADLAATPPGLRLSPYHLGCLLAAAAAIFLACKGVLVKDALLAGADPTAVIAVRMGVSLPCFAAVLWWTSREAPRLGWRTIGLVAALGVIGFHLASWLDVLGLRHVSVALERIVLYVYPSLVVGLNWALGRGRPSFAMLVAVAVTWLGIAVSFTDQRLAGGGIGSGVLLVLGSALAYAIYMVGIEPVLRRHGGLRTTALAMCAACAGVVLHGILAVPAALWAAQPPQLWRDGTLLAVFATVLPILMGGAAMRRIGGSPSAIISTIGPGVTVLAAWAWLGERPTAWTWAGLALTVAGSLVVGLYCREDQPTSHTKGLP